MSAHSLRAMFNRQNLVPFTIFFLLAVIVVCGFTAITGQSSAEASVVNAQGNGNGHVNQRPPEFANRSPEDIAKDFNDDDLKVKDQKPRGRWTTGIVSDMAQFNDDSMPVVVGAIQSLSGGGKYAGVFKVKRLEIKNRSSKAVNSVQLRWSITSLDDPSRVLLEDTLPFVNLWVEADSSKVIEIPTIYPLPLFKPLAKDGELNGQYKITIGMQEARFADGSFWRRREPVAWFNILYDDQTAANRFPQLASVSPIFPSFWADPGGSRTIIKQCEAWPGWITPASSYMARQETTCHDDSGPALDPTTLWLSCGTPNPGAACYQACNNGPCIVDTVPGGRCDPTPTPTPSPTPIPCPQPRPVYCCNEFTNDTLPGTPYCEWKCNSCPPGTSLPGGCVTQNADGSCPPGYGFTLDYGGACCPQTGCSVSELGDPGGFTCGNCWDGEDNDCDDAYDFGDSDCANCYPSPVLVDVLGDGFSLSDAAGGAVFDISGTGHPSRIAWPTGDDAWLALDRDGNGRIDSGVELFGNFTPQPAPPDGQERNGFLALAVFDRPDDGGNGDGLIDGRDSVFSSLRLWQDANRDGVSQPAELHTLPSLDVARLHLDYKESKKTDEYGNRFRYRAKVDDARGAKVNRWAWDVFLVAAR